MLAVRVDASAERVAVLERPAVARGDPDRAGPGSLPSESTSAPCSRATSAVRSVEPSSTTRTSASGSRSCRPVEDRGQVLLLVPGGDEDDACRSCAPPRELGPGGAELQRQERQRRELPGDRAEASARDARRERRPRRPSRGRGGRRAGASGARCGGAQTTTAPPTPRSSSSGRVRAAFSAVVPRRRLDDELDVGAAPRVPHLLGLRRPAGRRPAAEDDDVRAAARSRAAPPRGRAAGSGG